MYFNLTLQSEYISAKRNGGGVNFFVNICPFQFFENLSELQDDEVDDISGRDAVHPSEWLPLVIWGLLLKNIAELSPGNPPEKSTSQPVPAPCFYID